MENNKEVNTEVQAEEIQEVNLKEEEVKKIKHRTGQLLELIAFDPDNSRIYRNEIIETNIKLVSHVLRKYRPWGDDEFQLGCLGLIIATDTFDVSREVPFANYACFCIERELHKAHRKQSNTIEYILGKDLDSLDIISKMDNGDEVNKHEQVPDILSEEQFEKVLQDFQLEDFFEKVILPAIDDISGTTKGQNVKIDFEHWKELELRYIVEMAQEDSQKSRLSLSAMAKDLDLSTQNIRMRHLRVIDAIKDKCISLGYHM